MMRWAFCLNARPPRSMSTTLLRSSSAKDDIESSARRAWRSTQAPRSEEPVGRPRQPEILAQGFSLVFAPEQAAPLQLRHHAVDEIVEAARQVGEHDGEAVG